MVNHVLMKVYEDDEEEGGKEKRLSVDGPL